MDRNDFEKIIIERFGEVFKAQNSTLTLPDLSDDTVLLETGLDSLGFAILVTVLDEQLDYDPFSLSEDAYYPQTFGDFVSFYVDNYRK